MRFAVVGPGRAGGAFRTALEHQGARCGAVLGRSDDPATIDPTTDLVVIAVPDRAIGEVAARIRPGPLVLHVSGVTDLSPLLTHHERCGSLHPLVSLTSPAEGARALLAGAPMAVAAPTPTLEHEVQAVAELLGTSWFTVADDARPAYHAAACIAANHLVGLLAQIERITTDHEIPLAPFAAMMRAVIDNVERVGVASALTGPVARGDWETVRSHLGAIPVTEHPLYLELAAACATIAGHQLPSDLLPPSSASAPSSPPPAPWPTAAPNRFTEDSP